jgi:formate hydrogenlyase transcriptional activator
VVPAPERSRAVLDGLSELTNRGTLLLDLPLELQSKLLRVMQDGQFERLGSTVTIHSNVRVIFATHRNLVEMVNKE